MYVTHRTISSARIFQMYHHIITESPRPGFSKCMSHIFYTRNFQMYVTQSHIRDATGFSKMYVTNHTISTTRIFQMYVTLFHNLGFSENYVPHHHTISNTRIFQMYVTQSHIRLTQNSYKTSTTGFSKMYVTHHTISSTRIFQMYVTHFHNLGFSKTYVTNHHRISYTRIFQMYVKHF